VLDDTDCDDSRADVHPGAVEACDGIDDDCDGEADEDGLVPWYADADADGYGDPDGLVLACAAPSGYVDNNDDCDDGHSADHPGATESCDDRDNDCNGATDEGTTVPLYWDADMNGYGDPTTEELGCAPTTLCKPCAAWVTTGGDCDDTRADVNPSATETCDATAPFVCEAP